MLLLQKDRLLQIPEEPTMGIILVLETMRGYLFVVLSILVENKDTLQGIVQKERWRTQVIQTTPSEATIQHIMLKTIIWMKFHWKKLCMHLIFLQKKDYCWIIDSGATQHMTYDGAALSDYVECKHAVEITLGDNRVIYAYGKGIYRLTTDVYGHAQNIALKMSFTYQN